MPWTAVHIKIGVYICIYKYIRIIFIWLPVKIQNSVMANLLFQLRTVFSNKKLKQLLKINQSFLRPSFRRATSCRCATCAAVQASQPLRTYHTTRWQRLPRCAARGPPLRCSRPPAILTSACHPRRSCRPPPQWWRRHGFARIMHPNRPKCSTTVEAYRLRRRASVDIVN